MRKGNPEEKKATEPSRLLRLLWALRGGYGGHHIFPSARQVHHDSCVYFNKRYISKRGGACWRTPPPVSGTQSSFSFDGTCTFWWEEDFFALRPPPTDWCGRSMTKICISFVPSLVSTRRAVADISLYEAEAWKAQPSCHLLRLTADKIMKAIVVWLSSAPMADCSSR